MVNIFELFLERDLWLLIPELYLFWVIIVLTILGVFFNKAVKSVGKKPLEVVMYLAVLGLFWTGVLFLCESGLDVFIFNYQIKKDNFNIFFIGLILLGGIASLLMSLSYIKADSVDEFEYVILILLAILGMITIVTCNDLLVIYLGIELQSLCLYVLATLKRHSRFSTEAGLKYFVLGAFASGVLLFGMSLFYGFTGMTNLSEVVFFFENVETISGGVSLGLLLILIGLLFKVGAVPFHVWLPDVYSGAPMFVTSFFAIVPKIAIFGLIGKFFIMCGGVNSLDILLLYSGLLSLAVGSLGAIYQTTVKRLIAYSAIGHTGFLLLAMYAGGVEGLVSVCLYLLIYVLMLINVFSIFLSVRDESTGKGVRLLGTFNEVYRSNKLLGVFLCLLLFSMAGVPPLSGFYSKLYVFFVMIKEELFFASIIGVLLSALGGVYYLRLIRTMFFNKSRQWGIYKVVDKFSSLLIVYSGLFAIFFCVYSGPILVWLQDLVLQLYL